MEIIDHQSTVLCLLCFATYLTQLFIYFMRNIGYTMPSVLWHCWLGSRKGIRLVKYWVVWCWHGYLSGVMLICIWPSWCHCHSLSLASVKSKLVLPFWYRLTRVVPDKGPLNGVCVTEYWIASGPKSVPPASYYWQMQIRICSDILKLA